MDVWGAEGGVGGGGERVEELEREIKSLGEELELERGRRRGAEEEVEKMREAAEGGGVKDERAAVAEERAAVARERVVAAKEKKQAEAELAKVAKEREEVEGKQREVEEEWRALARFRADLEAKEAAMEEGKGGEGAPWKGVGEEGGADLQENEEGEGGDETEVEEEGEVVKRGLSPRHRTCKVSFPKTLRV